MSVAVEADPVAADGVSLGFVDAEGVERREPLASCSAVAFEESRAVRTFRSFRGQRNWPGLWWSATAGAHVGFESWLERDHAMMLDFDSTVVGFAPQPFWLFFAEAGGSPRRHAPDWFARLVDGRGLVIDCRPDGRIKAKDAVVFEATRVACEQVGWRYRRVGAVDPVLAGNVRWLAGYRHPRHGVAGVVQQVLAAFAGPGRLSAAAATVGDPVAVLPVVFHLMWKQVLTADLSVRLGMDTLVWAAPGWVGGMG